MAAPFIARPPLRARTGCAPYNKSPRAVKTSVPTTLGLFVLLKSVGSYQRGRGVKNFYALVRSYRGFFGRDTITMMMINTISRSGTDAILIRGSIGAGGAPACGVVFFLRERVSAWRVWPERRRAFARSKSPAQFQIA